MHLFPSIVTSLVLTSVVASQSATTLVAETVMGVYAQDGSAPAGYNTRASGFQATPTRPLAVRIGPAGSGPNPDHARTKASLRDLEGFPAMRIFEAGTLAATTTPRLRAVGTATQAGSASTGVVPHSWLLQFRGQPGQRVRVQSRLRSTIVGHSPQPPTPTDIDGYAQVDLGADGSVEFTQALDGRRYLDNRIATLGASGQLQIRVETGARIRSTDQTAAAYGMTLDVSLEPVEGMLASMSPYGTCGPDLFGIEWETGGQRQVRVILEGATPSANAALVIGSGRIDLPIPGMVCNLLTSPVFTALMRTGPTGRILIDFPTFPATMIAAANIQFAVLSPSGALVLSKGMAFRSALDHPGPYEHFDVNHILSTGQSLAVGGLGSPALSTTQSYGNLMFKGGVGAVSGSLVPLVENFWETMSSSMSALASQLYLKPYNDSQAPAPANTHVSLVSIHASPGYGYGLLKRGTQPFDTGLSQFRSAQAIAGKANQSYIVRCVTCVHGETDHTLYNTNYADNMVEWQRDYEQEVQARGQTDPVPMIHSQVSSQTAYFASRSVIPGLQLEASVRFPRKLPLVGPRYIFEYTDGVHLTARGYRHMGEYYGKVYNHIILEGGTWEPLRPLTAERQGKVIYLRFHVPEPPLVLDTKAVLDPGNFGFEYFDDSGSSPVIQKVELVDEDTVALTLSALPIVGAKMTVAYAHTGIASQPGGPTSGVRGNLRDSDETPSLHNGPLYNWAVQFALDLN